MTLLPRLTLMTISAFAASAAMAQAPAKTPKPIVKTTCSEYVALDETIKPKFIYMAVGHSSKGKETVVFDEVATEKIKPELDEYCKVNLTKSAYQHVMETSIASEKAARKAHHGK